MLLSVTRKLPSGKTKSVHPYHVCMKGLSDALLCRDNEDYGVLVKYIAVCARRENVIVIIYEVNSNHCHVAVLSSSYQDACNYGDELKRTYAQWFQIKYREKHILKDTDVQAILLDSEWYVRNALAYVPRNAIDNGCPVDSYRWSGYRAMFADKTNRISGLPVCKFTRREQDRIMHTRDNLKGVPWLVDADGDLMPETFCDADYLEQAFNHDQAFWLKTIGALNPAEMEEKLVNSPRQMLPDSELFKVVSDISGRWFSLGLNDLPIEKKLRILPYIYRTRKTTVKQLARVLGMDREDVRRTLRIKKEDS